MSYSFDSSTVDQSELNSFDALPAGKYVVSVDTAGLKDTKSGDGKLFVVCFSVATGENEGRKIFQNFNVENPSVKAQNIGRAQLAQCLMALGHPKLDLANPEPIVDKVVVVDLGVRKSNFNGEMENNIKKFISKNEAVAKASATAGNGPVKKSSDLPTDPGLDSIPF